MFKKLICIERLLKEHLLLEKEVLTLKEAAQYLSLSPSNIYKHTMNQTIPCYKPNRKLLYFKRTELENWIFENRIATISELKQSANNFKIKGGKNENDRK